MRLDVALVNRLGGEPSFHHHVRRGERGFGVTSLVKVPDGNVGRLVGRGFHALGDHLRVKYRGALRHGLFEGRHEGQDLVLDRDRFRCLPCCRPRGGRHRSHSMALVEHFVAGDDVARHVVVIDPGLTGHGGLVMEQREVGAGDDGLDAVDGLGRRRVYRNDPGMGMRRA